MSNMLIGQNIDGVKAELLGTHANRHGLIAGATGTGKTVTLKRLAEQFSAAGVPVFLADVKGDITGICQPGSVSSKLTEIITARNIDEPEFRGYPTIFWDLYGEQGHQMRTTISEMGPLLLSRVLNLSEAQESLLTIVFKIADDEGLLLHDTKDLKSMLNYVYDSRKELERDYGGMSTQSISTVQRKIIALEEQDADKFFGLPELDLADMMLHDDDGRGYINLLAADRLMQSPQLYSTFLLWLLSELFEELPEVGDPDIPKFVFFFDEAHLLFDDTPKHLQDKIEQVVKLIRSKGVGVYFVTQNPVDIPDDVLGQLGNRIQHALRAFTPKEQKAIKQAAETYRTNPDLDIARVVQELEVGEALISFLNEDGAPTIVDRYFVIPTESAFGPADDNVKQTAISHSPVSDIYSKAVDKESAHEELSERLKKHIDKKQPEGKGKSTKKPGRKRQSAIEAGFKSAMRSVGTQLGRAITRGVLGALKR
ncbi:MAG: helicase HerA-like domain-containing protein [Patescibacteria group bacterium]